MAEQRTKEEIRAEAERRKAEGRGDHPRVPIVETPEEIERRRRLTEEYEAERKQGKWVVVGLILVGVWLLLATIGELALPY
jgi:hypothetical protein